MFLIGWSGGMPTFYSSNLRHLPISVVSWCFFILYIALTFYCSIVLVIVLLLDEAIASTVKFVIESGVDGRESLLEPAK